MRAGTGKGRKNGGFRRFLRAPVICAGLVLASVFAAPTMVNAFSSNTESLPVSLAARGALGSFTPASVDPRLVTQGAIRALTHGRLFRFTPAGMDNRPDRAVTVAVRVTGEHTQFLASHSAQADAGAGFAAVRITPVAYNLGMARGYQSFALPSSNVIHDLPHDNSELRTFSLAATTAEPSAGSFSSTPRLSADVAADENAAPGRSPRTLGTQGDYQVKMGGSYRLIGNLDVTAGLRYTTERDQLRAMTDHRQDSQAIYVGTKFRF
ncbi:hypothetical protein [Novosphingobium sp. FSW06-99]|uniref:hypothetical protein n=1 Tax=Novosphingobium sp. FSW06-99 TaxID=1739113 RepID=UPI00076D5556|nr:hypothetical protein [Novosphingobium sp. FSW06-99]KUR75584.1 hypothetical protein AQZ49_13990 [Novosphingobium sp. FSW06-99]